MRGTSAHRGSPCAWRTGRCARLGQKPKPAGSVPRASPSARLCSVRGFLPEPEARSPWRLGGTSLQTLKAENGQGTGRREGPGSSDLPGDPRDKAAAPRTEHDLPGPSRRAPGGRGALGTRRPRGDPRPLSSCPLLKTRPGQSESACRSLAQTQSPLRLCAHRRVAPGTERNDAIPQVTGAGRGPPGPGEAGRRCTCKASLPGTGSWLRALLF